MTHPSPPSPPHQTAHHRRLINISSVPTIPPSIPPPDGGERIVELCFDDPFPDYDTEPVMAYANDREFAA